ncbi:MAG TPA: hypothetical protein VD905_07490 [Flavobacteriales bacterium]|nr:hypothetical protein [Flavobacteriales bacterium]
MENKNEPVKGKQPNPVTPDGSLGLLALGYRGLIAWREAKKEWAEKMKQQQNDGKKS